MIAPMLAKTAVGRSGAPTDIVDKAMTSTGIGMVKSLLSLR
jgi:hypothetical protein